MSYYTLVCSTPGETPQDGICFGDTRDPRDDSSTLPLLTTDIGEAQRLQRNLKDMFPSSKYTIYELVPVTP